LGEPTSIKIKKSRGIYVGVVIHSSITAQQDLDAFSSEILGFLDKHGGAPFVLDFRHVRYLSSAVLGELVAIHRSVQEKSGSLRLCHLHSKVKEVFEVTRLHEQIDIDENLRDSLKILGATEA
jgi:anti-anti-sigma factor